MRCFMNAVNPLHSRVYIIGDPRLGRRRDENEPW
jgi:hypothetical protein